MAALGHDAMHVSHAVQRFTNLMRLLEDREILTTVTYILKLSEEYGEALRFFEYDMLYGKKYVYDKKTPYKATALQMGVLDITVSDVVCEGDNLRVLGENFTEWSVVCINGKKCKTVYRSENELYVENKDVKENDKITVRQITDDRVTLGESSAFRIN